MCKPSSVKPTLPLEKAPNGLYTFKEIIVSMECNFGMEGSACE